MLRTAWVVPRHELHRIATERTMIVFGAILPVLIIVLVGLTFGGGSIGLGVVDADGSPRSAELVAALRDRRGVDVRVYDSERAMRQAVRTTDIEAGVLLEEGYGDDVDRGSATVPVIVDPSSEGAFSALATVDAVITAAGVHEAAVQLVRDQGVGAATARRQVADTETQLAPVEVRVAREIGLENPGGEFSYTAPSNLVLFVFINTFAVSAILANDRKSGVLRRQLSTPNRPSAILFGIGASKFAFSMVQTALILVVGALAFDVRWGNPLGVAALTVAFAALATSVGLLVGSVASGADQAQSIGIPLSVALGMLGGCMWPLAIVPRPMQVAGHVTPHAWAMDAWRELIYDRAGIAAILPNLAVLVGAAVVVGLVAVRGLRRAVLG